MLKRSWISHGADEQTAALLDRAAARMSLDDPHTVAWLLGRLRRAGADKETAALLDRNPAARVSLDSPHAVIWLLDRLREAGADEQAAGLLDRLPAAGCFDQWIRSGGDPMRFRFGREPDGSTAPPWAWDDLE
ncbi:hypothetical protein [Streptomyces sp. NPDC053069]|uniref:hypothetical protein n=1 Tax=Streptomyces sp. NPDC053069 TaxID=3365695 RepID=UPI0037D6B46C